MNLKVLLLLLIYWCVVIVAYAPGLGSPLAREGLNTTAILNDTSLTANETDTGGVFSGGVDFGRFFLLVSFGFDADSTAPYFIQFLIILFQSVVTVFSVGFVISSIWDG